MSNLDYIINEEASNFSSGEKVRLDISRNIIKKPDIVMMDEPFAHLDNENINIITNC